MACELLDDYLARDLGETESARFVDHLAACAECRLAVVENERLERLLRAANERLVAVPAGLARRRRWVLSWRTAAVAASVAAAVWWATHTGHPPPTTVPQVAEVPPAPRVTFPRDTVIAVPQETGSPNVTFLWVYPARRPGSRDYQ